MIPYLKNLFTDEGAFIGFVRTTLMVLGAGIATGQFPEVVPQWAGLVAVGASSFIRSSTKTEP